MANFTITRGKVERAQKVVIYGPEGIGKTTLAAAFPGPVFIDTEGGTDHLDVARLPSPTSWAMLTELVKHARDTPGLCGTLVIDTADWAEQLCVAELCAKNQRSGLEDFGYGKGYGYLAEAFGRLLNLLNEVIERGVNVVFTAHAQTRKFDQPDELGAYDRWEMKLQKKTGPLLKEWADMVLFANYKTYVINVDNQGAQKGRNKAQGGERVLYTSHHPCWDAKNRQGLPEEMPLRFSSFAHCIPHCVPRATAAGPAILDSLGTQSAASRAEPMADARRHAAISAESRDLAGTTRAPDIPPAAPEPPAPPRDGIPDALRQLMQAHGVTAEDIQEVVGERGYYPRDTPIDHYDPAFVSGVLIGAWDQVYAMCQTLNTTPF
jgi:hypothetical protein